MAISILEARVSDAALIHAITQAAFAEYDIEANPPFPAHGESEADVARALKTGGAALAWEGDMPLGAARYAAGWHEFTIQRVAVLPGQRGRGVARQLIEALEAMALAKGYGEAALCTRLSVARNVAMYERLGYHVDDMWQNTPDADVQVRMVKRLCALTPLYA